MYLLDAYQNLSCQKKKKKSQIHHQKDSKSQINNFQSLHKLCLFQKTIYRNLLLEKKTYQSNCNLTSFFLTNVIARIVTQLTINKKISWQFKNLRWTLMIDKHQEIVFQAIISLCLASMSIRVQTTLRAKLILKCN